MTYKIMYLWNSCYAFLWIAALASAKEPAGCRQVSSSRPCRCWNSEITCDNNGATNLKYLNSLPFHITEVSITRNNLFSLREGEFDALVNITSLTIQHCGVSNIENKSLWPLTSLEYLDLSHNELREFNLHSTDFSSLKSLDLSFNSLLHLTLNPTLRSMTSLLLQENKLSLPENTFQFPNVIERVKIFGNRIQNLGFLKHLPQVKTVWLSQNNLSEVSEEAFRLNTKVEYLRLDSNKIRNIDFVKNLKYMKGLNLTNNMIETVPETLFKNMSYLTHLYLDDNMVSDTTFLKHMNSNLETLFMSNNAISNFINFNPKPKSLLSLKRLSLSHNRISTLSFVSDFSNMEMLLASDNALKLLSEYIFNKTRLNFLDISNNEIKNLNFIPHSKYLKYLIVNNNELPGINPNVLENCRIEELDISYNKLESLEFARKMHSLKKLYVTNNNISVIPDDTFRENVVLQELDLSENIVDNFDFLHYASRLRSLFTSDCSIQSRDSSALKCSRKIDVYSAQTNSTLEFIKSTDDLWNLCNGKKRKPETVSSMPWTVMCIITVLALLCLTMLLLIILLETVIRCHKRRRISYMNIQNGVNKGHL